MIKQLLQYSYLLFFSVTLVGCGYPDIVERFNETDAYELAKAVHDGDIDDVRDIVNQNPELMEVPSSSGINTLILAIHVEEYESFKILLELGADPNYRNPINTYTPLIESIRPFGSVFEWRTDLRYQRELLRYGADPNLSVDTSFTNVKRTWVTATSPAIKASFYNLESLKLLLEYGVDYEQRIEGASPFSKAVSGRKFETIDFYIDSLGIDVHEPMDTVIRKPSNKEVTFYIQDYINRFMGYEIGSEGYDKKQALIKKLEGMGVDFENYEYQL